MPAPGWYPSPNAEPGAAPTVRWWDGTAWTEHVAPAVAPGAAPAPTTPDGVPVVSWGRRVGAYLIDGLIVGAIATVLQLPLLLPTLDSMRQLLDEVDPATGELSDAAALDLFVELAWFWLIAVAIGIATNVVYHSVFLRMWSATPGKRAVGLRVRRWEAEGPLDWPTVLKRTGTQFVLFGLLALSFLQLLDVLWPLWDRRRQAVHDKAAGTVVVDAAPSS